MNLERGRLHHYMYRTNSEKTTIISATRAHGFTTQTAFTSQYNQYFDKCEINIYWLNSLFLVLA